MVAPPLIFVTAFIDLEEDRSKDKSVSRCFEHFAKLAATGIPLYVFLSKSYKAIYDDVIGSPKNVTIEYIELRDLNTYKALEDIPCNLPTDRTPHHDTKNFLILMNSKLEFIKRAMDATPSTHYGWIDFSIFHVVKDEAATSAYLKMLAVSRLKDKCLVMPGCVDKQLPAFSKVCWRFCGGFLLGDRASLLSAYNSFEQLFRGVVYTMGLTWEVNMWAFMEFKGHLKPTWVKANHDDSIVRIPSSLFKVVASLTTIPPREDAFRLAIESLMDQVDHIYVSVAKEYKRFGKWRPPSYLMAPPYSQKVSLVFGEDKGPATKYVGALGVIPHNTWVFICDDDQEYHPTLIERMKESVAELAVYQNHYENIRRKTSGGLIHGYVGLLMHTSFVKGLGNYILPESAYFVDDQWASIYCFKEGIPIRKTRAEYYHEIYSVLENSHEKLGAASLAALNNRDEKVAELAKAFGVKFLSGGDIVFDQ